MATTSDVQSAAGNRLSPPWQIEVAPQGLYNGGEGFARGSSINQGGTTRKGKKPSCQYLIVLRFGFSLRSWRLSLRRALIP